MSYKVLVVDDESEIADLIEMYLQNENYTVYKSYTAQSALEYIESEKLDLAILDVMLPDIDGFQICKKIREKYTYPVIMLTAKAEIEDRIQGLDSGADDYMVKPFDFRELNARISILLKRCQIPTVECIEYADLKVYLRTKSVSRNGQSIILTPKEYNLLLFFVQNPERILTRTEIAEKVWDTHFDTGTNFIDVYINYLRKKIDKNFNTKLIHTKPGMGFIFSYENPY